MRSRWFSWLPGFANTVFWALGYFVGFSLVGIVSVGQIVPAPFDEIERHRPNDARSLVFRRHGRFYLAADAVALAGWLFLGIASWLTYLAFIR